MVTRISLKVLGLNLDGEGVVITRASVDAYTDALMEALTAAFPDAEVEIETEYNVSGLGCRPHIERDGEPVYDHRTHDAVKSIIDRTWEAWTMSPAARGEQGVA